MSNFSILILAFCYLLFGCSSKNQTKYSNGKTGDKEKLERYSSSENKSNVFDLVNGKKVEHSFFPAVVKIGGCTGTIVAEDLILTAAHCLRVGEDNQYSEQSFETEGFIIKYGKYKGWDTGMAYIPTSLQEEFTNNDDIAIVKLKENLTFESGDIFTNILREGMEKPSVNDYVMLMGYGRKEGGDNDFSKKRIGFNKISEVTDNIIKIRSNRDGGGQSSGVLMGDSGSAIFKISSDYITQIKSVINNGNDENLYEHLKDKVTGELFNHLTLIGVTSGGTANEDNKQFVRRNPEYESFFAPTYTFAASEVFQEQQSQQSVEVAEVTEDKSIIEDKRCGYYKRFPVLNKWHEVYITKEGDKYLWTNAENRSWLLEDTDSDGKYEVLYSGQEYYTGNQYEGSEFKDENIITGPFEEEYVKQMDIPCDGLLD